MKNTQNILVSEVSFGSQSAEYHELLKIGKRKLRIEIDSDAHDFQSSAVIKLWDAIGEAWKHVESIHYSKMSTPKGLKYRNQVRTVTSTDFRADRDELIRRALLIVE